MTEMISLSKIDPNIIKLIRPLSSVDSEQYKILQSSIEKDGQKHPITIRRLTEEELTNPDFNIKEGAEYGIIDGHHRFDIAQKNKADKILAEIDSATQSDYHDTMLAFRLNASSIKMTPLEKGKIIYTLSEETGKDIREIGEEIFGLKTAMLYRCVNVYKKSIGAKTVSKPRKSKEQFNFSSFKKSFAELRNLPKTQANFTAMLNDVSKSNEALKTIEIFEKQLAWVKEQIKNSIPQ